jgi:GTPase KRas protein
MHWSHIDIHGFILMYSIDSRDSFEGVERYYQDLIRTNDGTSKLVLVGNKVDKLDQREVTSDEGYALARRLGCPFFETSAKTRVNVEEAFSALVRILHDSEAKKLETPAPMAGARGKGEKQMSRRWQKRCVVF